MHRETLKKFRRHFCVVNVTLALLVPIDLATAASTATVSGTVTDLSGAPGRPQVQMSPLDDRWGRLVPALGSPPRYSIELPNPETVDIYLSKQDQFHVVWEGRRTFTQTSELNFTIPSPFVISGKVVDYAGRALVANLEFAKADRMDSYPVAMGENPWAGYSQQHKTVSQVDGSFTLFSYSTAMIAAERQIRVTVPSENVTWTSMTFVVEKSFNTKICIPTRETGATPRPPDCLDDVETQLQRIREAARVKAAAEALAKAEAEAKERVEAEQRAAAEAKLRELAEAASRTTATGKKNVPKKVTIVCVKGRLVKQITSLTPKCPAGYKRKVG